MVGLPNVGEKVKVWPAHGRRVQNGPRPLDPAGGGQALHPQDGAEVIWSEFHMEQMKMGDLQLHPPPDSQAALVREPVKAASSKKSE